MRIRKVSQYALNTNKALWPPDSNGCPVNGMVSAASGCAIDGMGSLSSSGNEGSEGQNKRHSNGNSHPRQNHQQHLIELYGLNGSTGKSLPGKDQELYSTSGKPIRNGDAGLLAADFLRVPLLNVDVGFPGPFFASLCVKSPTTSCNFPDPTAALTSSPTTPPLHVPPVLSPPPNLRLCLPVLVWENHVVIADNAAEGVLELPSTIDNESVCLGAVCRCYLPEFHAYELLLHDKFKLLHSVCLPDA